MAQLAADYEEVRQRYEETLRENEALKALSGSMMRDPNRGGEAGAQGLERVNPVHRSRRSADPYRNPWHIKRR